MRVLNDEKWQGGFLDYYRSDREYRVQVLAWKNLDKIDDMYFIRPNSLRLIWNYLHKVGPVAVMQKILSRKSEKLRNEKYISCGIGEVVQCPVSGKFTVGDLVVFVAPNHPKCVERVVLPEELLEGLDSERLPFERKESILYVPISEEGHTRHWKTIRGWNIHSGVQLSDKMVSEAKATAWKSLQETDWSQAVSLRIDSPTNVQEVKESDSYPKRGKDKRGAVLYGYGNYAKMTIIPYVSKAVPVKCAHEVDPTQIPRMEPNTIDRWDTAPCPRLDESYGVYFIAGFHHCHAPLAVHALKKGACAVVEKPIAVNEVQLNELVQAMQNSNGKLFSCFQKRYLPFNDMARKDMGLKEGDPVHYHAIVYEVPLPALHWYRWPNSRSRVMSNGCHWIDHFLFLNDFCDMENYNVFTAHNGSLNCSLELINGALFTMTLTEQGSERLGVQDHVELRANGVTVRMVNDSKYTSENLSRIIRKSRINKRHAYKIMYNMITNKIVRNEPGESAKSVYNSCNTIIAFDKILMDQFGSHSN
jgi:hypothetical protein